MSSGPLIFLVITLELRLVLQNIKIASHVLAAVSVIGLSSIFSLCIIGSRGDAIVVDPGVGEPQTTTKPYQARPGGVDEEEDVCGQR